MDPTYWLNESIVSDDTAIALVYVSHFDPSLREYYGGASGRPGNQKRE
jgi:hypothetical protein